MIAVELGDPLPAEFSPNEKIPVRNFPSPVLRVCSKNQTLFLPPPLSMTCLSCQQQRKQGRGENATCIFFAFLVLAKSCILLHFFLHLDATSAKERVSQREGSCIFKTFDTGAEGMGPFDPLITLPWRHDYSK
jgi:hypothetical protein